MLSVVELPIVEADAAGGEGANILPGEQVGPLAEVYLELEFVVVIDLAFLLIGGH
jgi:hypothetical protein